MTTVQDRTRQERATRPSAPRPGQKPRRHRRWPWVLLALPFVIWAILAIALDPIAEWRTRKALSELEAYQGTFDAVHVHPFKLTYTIEGLKVTKESAGGQREPFFATDSMEVGLFWRELLHLHLVARVWLDHPKMNLINATAKQQKQLQPEEPNLDQKLDDLIPLKADRIEVRNGEVRYVDKTEPEFPQIFLHHVEATIENLATRAALSRGEPTVVAIAGKAQKDAEFSAWISADPLAHGLFFAGRFRVAKLDLSELGEMLASKTGLRADRGRLEVFSEFDCRDGYVTGGVKPVIKNAHVVQAKPGLKNKLKAVLADAALDLFSDRVKNRDAVATVIPIAGHVSAPQPQIWPTVFGVVRNAFVEGVSESYERLPPPESDKKEGVVEQAVKALNPKKDAPKAQPTKATGKK